MQIRVLGCSGSIAAGCRTTSFLVGHHILIDAGTGVGDLTLEELAAVDHICITHSHLDHVLAIGLLADSVARLRSERQRPPVQVHALGATIAVLRAHIFNGLVWPDFTRLPNPAPPILAFDEVQLGQVLNLDGVQVEVLSAAHTVPAVGYAVMNACSNGGAWVFTGDTGPNPLLWERLAQMHVGALVIETAFRDDQHAVASISQHLCPSKLKVELDKLASPADVYITHIKPGEVHAVMSEIGAQDSRHRISALQTGQVMGASSG